MLEDLFYWIGFFVCLFLSLGLFFMVARWAQEKYTNFVYQWANVRLISRIVQEWKIENEKEYERRMLLVQALALKDVISNIRSYKGVQDIKKPE